MPSNEFVDQFDMVEEDEPIEQAEPVTPEPEPKGDPDVVDDGQQEEPKEDSPEEQPVVNPYDQKFRERGLDRQFKSLDDVLDRLPLMNKWQTELSQRNAELERKFQELNKPQPEPYDPDAFIDNPDKYLEGKYSKAGDVEQLRQKVQYMELAQTVNQFKSVHPDYDEVEPIMTQILQDDPGILQTRNPLEYLYVLARQRKPAGVTAAVEKTKGQIESQVAREKVSAETTPSKPRKPKSTAISVQELQKMPLDELRARFADPGDKEDEGF